VTQERKRILFICVGNACRSQMAEALARHLAADIIEASSAGLSPMGAIPDATRQVLLERGVALTGQRSKGTDEASLAAIQLIINLTGIPGKALFREGLAAPVEDWDVGDPYGEDLVIYRQICDEIEVLVQELAERLRTGASPKKPAR
jgi:protein-tyrosine-phosphatase